jgi:hypothetical protein
MNDALMKIVPFILKLESTVGMMHLAEVECIHPDEWHELANDLRQAVWNEDNSTTQAHKVAIAAARPESEPPGSKADPKCSAHTYLSVPNVWMTHHV